MKILYIHNDYAKPSGEEHASGELIQLLKEHGHVVEKYSRSSAEIADSAFGKIKSFFTGIWNPLEAKRLRIYLKRFKPDVAIVQNLYPLLSPSIFKPLKDIHVPVVMRCPNYRLFCPGGLCLDNDGHICEKCFGRGKEWWCIRKNCEKSLFKSVGYAARNAVARKSKAILDGVDVFIVQSAFQKEKFILQGIQGERIGILPGIAPVITEGEEKVQIGNWFTFVGRVSEEKGIYEFIEAAKHLPHLTFKVAGNLDGNFKKPTDMPTNVEFTGFLKGRELDDLYRKSRAIVVPSKWYEGFPNVIVRGMLLKRPVITSDIGAMQSIIDNGVNGITVSPGDTRALKKAIEELSKDENKSIEYGLKGYEKASSLYSREQIYLSLQSIINQAVKIR
ncbi:MULTISPECIES: glycosyltransferase family 4 protein [Bacteroidales]|uniref:glycosyltransferase family 4 protein n=1 Tax=Bacteroidales TaxID=171549 RepID=UPI001897972E|nr:MULTISPECIES: glycosyltransferase family 4 protein [Bacteroidales]MBV4222467.1 glycosyltransferase family 4 protein [Bacteroides xylanisolvens]MCB6664510.1 glycosyltransferase family 4 protein [Phocaeicola dorei]MCB6720481.1 glycosyltransferase family 4 protein [Bacteroides fragilis]MCC2781208.1 glycosyltransferase family 4 protein [Parabacteroides distasonis]MCQ5174213.1 glycosyltransferase family 4 protein [Bacteroides fragilis]